MSPDGLPGSVAAGRVPAVPVRVLASVVDLLLIWSWLGLLTGIGALVRRRLGNQLASDRRPPLVAVDAAVFAGTVLPVAGYFVASEGRGRQASIGKRLCGLVLEADPGGGPVPTHRVVARTSVKLVPWQLAHLYVARTMLGQGSRVVANGAQALSLVLSAVSVAFAVRDPHQRGLHDRIAASRVVVTEPSRLAKRR